MVHSLIAYVHVFMYPPLHVNLSAFCGDFLVNVHLRGAIRKCSANFYWGGMCITSLKPRLFVMWEQALIISDSAQAFPACMRP